MNRQPEDQPISSASLPNLIYLPGGVSVTGEPRIDVRTDVATGNPALLVYSSLTRLLAAHGEDKGWLSVTRAGLQSLIDTLGVGRVVLDLAPAHEPSHDDDRWESDAPLLRTLGRPR